MDRSASSLFASLENAIQTNTRTAWEGFIEQAHRIVASAVYHGLSRWRTPDKSQVDELIQETFLKLCARDFAILRRLRADGPEAIAAYLRSVTASVVLDSFRSKAALKRAPGENAIPLDELRATQGGTESSEAVERTLLLNAISHCLSDQPQRDRSVFWLYYRHGLTATAIAGIRSIDLTAKGVESLLRRLVIAVRNCLKIETSGGIPQKSKGSAA